MQAATPHPSRSRSRTSSTQRSSVCISIESNPAFQSPPSAYVCPITADIMRDPVSTIDGYCYEREAIEKWFSCHDTSPMTNLKLKSKLLTPQVRLVLRYNFFLVACNCCKYSSVQIVLRQSIEEWWEQHMSSPLSPMGQHRSGRADQHEPSASLSAGEEEMLGITRSEMRELLVISRTCLCTHTKKASAGFAARFFPDESHENRSNRIRS